MRALVTRVLIWHLHNHHVPAKERAAAASADVEDEDKGPCPTSMSEGTSEEFTCAFFFFLSAAAGPADVAMVGACSSLLCICDRVGQDVVQLTGDLHCAAFAPPAVQLLTGRGSWQLLMPGLEPVH